MLRAGASNCERVPGSRVIGRWRPPDARPEVLGGALSWQPAGATQALTVDLAGLFARINGEAL